MAKVKRIEGAQIIDQRVAQMKIFKEKRRLEKIKDIKFLSYGLKE